MRIKSFRTQYWVSALFLLVLAVYYYYWLDGLFQADLWAYHDLSILSNYVSYQLPRGDVFAISHFTPSLLLLSPIFNLISTQFLLVFLSLTAFISGTYILILIFDGFLKNTWLGADPSPIGKGIYVALVSGATLFLGLNVFGRSNIEAGHYEIFYYPFAALSLFFLIQQKSKFWILPPLLLALGVREDAGFYVCFQSLSLLLLPKGLVKDRRKLVRSSLFVALFSFGYSILVIKILIHSIGGDPNFFAARFWRDFGNTWEQIFLGIVSSPSLVWDRLQMSAIGRLNQSQCFLTFLNPPMTFLSHLPGFLLFVSDDYAKSQLFWHNSAFLLPGVFLSSLSGVSGFISSLKSFRLRGYRYVLLGIFSLSIFGYLSTHTFYDRVEGGKIRFYPERMGTKGVQNDLRIDLAGCRQIHQVASDYRNIIFLPNRIEKVLLGDRLGADAVILFKNASFLLTAAHSWSDLKATLISDRFWHLYKESEHYLFFVRSRDLCTASLRKS